jgi:hypothetical protein
MLQIIHSDREWTSVIRETLMQHEANPSEIIFCSSVEEWEMHPAHSVVFVEESQIPLLSGFNGKIITLYEEGVCTTQDAILAYSKPCNVVDQIIQYNQLGLEISKASFVKTNEKTNVLITAHSSDEFAHEFAECYVKQHNRTENRKTAIVNFQILPRQPRSQPSIPITKLILQPNDPVEQFKEIRSNINFHCYYNSFQIEEYLSLESQVIHRIVEKLSDNYDSVFFIVDQANLLINAILSKHVDSIICTVPNRNDHEWIEQCLKLQNTLTNNHEITVHCFSYSDSWKKSLSSEVEQWITSKSPL